MLRGCLRVFKRENRISEKMKAKKSLFLARALEKMKAKIRVPRLFNDLWTFSRVYGLAHIKE